MNYIRKLKWAGLPLAVVMSVVAVALFFFTHPTAHIAGSGSHHFLCAAGVAALPEAEFQQKLMKGVEDIGGEITKVKTDQQKILEDYGRTDKEVKKAAEDLQRCMTMQNEQALTLKRLNDLMAAIQRNARSSFGDPIARALKNDETRAFFDAVGRAVAAKVLDTKLDPAYAKIIDEGKARFKSLTGVDAGLGQATVPQQTFDEIYDTLLEYGQWSTLGVMRVGMRTVVLPLATARPLFYWIGSSTGGVGEGSAITAGNFSGSSVTGKIQTLAVYITVSRELLADSTVDLAPYIMRGLTQSTAQGLDTAAFIGTGNADQTSAGQYGIFNIASVNTNCGATTAQGNTLVGATTVDDWENVLNTVNAEVFNRNPKWWLHPQIIAKLVLVRDKNGRPIFQTWLERPDSKSLGQILNWPIIPTSIAPNTDGPGNVIAAFGDPEGQAVLVRSDLELATSDDILFAQNMRAFRALMRAGVQPKTLANSQTLIPLASLTLSPN